jgi:fumarate reductase flavoprotein subunit
VSNKHHNRSRVSRRDFVKGAAVGAGALAGASALASCAPTATPSGGAGLPEKWDKEADVVVVGGGGAGCATAMSAAEAGAKVILLEAAPALGGESSLCVGSVSAPLSSLQKEQGISDTVEDYVEDVIHSAGSNGSRSDRALVQWLGENGGPTIDWLIGLGVDIRGPFEYPTHHRVNRMHMLYPNASEWPKALRSAMEAKGVEILLQTKGVELYATCDNRVAGVKAVDQVSQETMSIKAKKGVVLAAGDLTGSEEFRTRFTTPDVAAVPAAHAFNDGSGLLIAMDLGADLTRLDSYGSPGLRAGAPGPNVSVTGKQAWMPYGMIDAGAILVNKDGARFVNEKDSSSALALATMDQPDQTCFMVYDDVVAQIFNEWPMVVSSYPGIGDVSGQGGWGSVDDFISRNGIKTGDTIEALAAEMGIDPAGLADAIETWNSYAEQGEDPDFERPTFGHPDAGTVGAGIKVAPLYCHGPIKPMVLLADCSLAVNTDLQVLDPFGEPIPGLYAGGNMGHGMMIAGGHGTHMAWCFSSGRHAGMNVAALEPWE